MSAPELVTYNRSGHVVELRLNRPDKLNALSNELVDELKEALYRFDADDEGWVAILSGEGRSFCAGADVSKRLGSAAGRGVSRATPITVLLSGFENTKPVITAVHGHACGAGFRLVLHSDFSVADTTAKFQLTEVNRGLDASQLWAEMYTRGFGTYADDLALTGRSSSAEEAHARGVIHRVVPAGKHLETAREVADQMLSNPPLAVRAIVRSRRNMLRVLEAQTAGVRRERTLHLTNDFRESVAAFKEKRKPKYTAS